MNRSAAPCSANCASEEDSPHRAGGSRIAIRNMIGWPQPFAAISTCMRCGTLSGFEKIDYSKSMKDDKHHEQTFEIPATPLALEGYAILHQMFRVRRASWRALDIAARNRAVAEAAALLGEMQRREDGESGLFSQLGHKGDLMIVHFRPSFEELNQAEIALANL